eukprot:gb/GECG01003589.1/.p1 GENE.gb/GECG01003589.1/~~gb/GECG01003589.1/.p1  ORF type:complete len:478 (+),score=61.28 gb/GECG01003589.1/:1-1434(+)
MGCRGSKQASQFDTIEGIEQQKIQQETSSTPQAGNDGTKIGSKGTAHACSDRPATTAVAASSEESANLNGQSEQHKEYDPQDFIVSEKTAESIVREPGSVGGQQFTIRDMKECQVLLFDHTDQITVEHCIDCLIFVGACSSSTFLRGCRGCRFILATQQLRLRECKDSTIELFSMVRPIIENSRSLSFMCLRWTYFGQEAHFEKAGLIPWDNRWSEVYDFSATGGVSTDTLERGEATGYSVNWSPVSLEVELSDTLADLPDDIVNQQQVRRVVTFGERSLYNGFQQTHAKEKDTEGSEEDSVIPSKWIDAEQPLFLPPTFGVIKRTSGDTTFDSPTYPCYIVVVLPSLQQGTDARQIATSLSGIKVDSEHILALTRSRLVPITKDTLESFKKPLKSTYSKQWKEQEKAVKECTKEVKKRKRKKLDMPKWIVLEFRGNEANEKLLLELNSLGSVNYNSMLVFTEPSAVTSAQKAFLTD